MQPPVPPAASTGADGAGSASGVLEAMVNRSAKKSIGVIVWWVVRQMRWNCSDAETPLHSLLLYLVSLS